MKTDLKIFLVMLGLIGVYVFFYDDIQNLKYSWASYLSVLSVLGFPLMIFFRKWKTTEREGKAKKLSKDEREMFSKIDAPQPKKKHVWPVGYGFNAQESTDEVIDRFINPDQGEESTIITNAPENTVTTKHFSNKVTDGSEGEEDKNS